MGKRAKAKVANQMLRRTDLVTLVFMWPVYQCGARMAKVRSTAMALAMKRGQSPKTVMLKPKKEQRCHDGSTARHLRLARYTEMTTGLVKSCPVRSVRAKEPMQSKKDFLR